MSNDGCKMRWVAWRNRWLASPAFQAFAARCWLTRPIARRRARALFDLVAGFTYSQTLHACVASGLLDLLGAGPAQLDAIAEHTGLPPAGAERLVKAAAALDLVQRVGDRWALGQAGAALTGNPGIAAMVAHHPALYADLADPMALLARGGGGGALARFWVYAENPGHGDAGAVADYSRLMDASLPLVARQALDAYQFARHRRLLDIGGGEGGFLRVVAAAVPTLELGLFDLPAVIERARAKADRHVVLHPGDFTRDPLPSGYDLVTLVRILHDHDDAPALALLRAIRTALPPGGRLLIIEPMAETAGARPAGDTYFGLYLLAMGSGRPRSPDEIAAMLTRAGFSTSRLLPTPLPITTRALLATV